MSPTPLEAAAATALAAHTTATSTANLTDTARERVVGVLADTPNPGELVGALEVEDVDLDGGVVVLTDGEVFLAVTAAGVVLVEDDGAGGWSALADVVSAASLGAALAGVPAPSTVEG